MDHLTAEARSKLMARVRQAGTSPELVVRKICWSLGYRYRLNQKKLPGKPDLVFPKLQKVVFVHGCFWHQHRKCPRSKLPDTNKLFWKNKLGGNQLRDSKTQRELRKLGWSILIVWECELRRLDRLVTRLEKFLEQGT